MPVMQFGEHTKRVDVCGKLPNELRSIVHSPRVPVLQRVLLSLQLAHHQLFRLHHFRTQLGFPQLRSHPYSYLRSSCLLPHHHLRQRSRPHMRCLRLELQHLQRECDQLHVVPDGEGVAELRVLC